MTDKELTLQQLKQDRENLMQQIQKLSGAINYIDQKIASLSKKEEK